ncbi:MAG: hypothetical protein EP343_15270 [Deltaproteobacteria bacterium]|nr:MAG: hypothetical protein EP343_15270 [Deltaproteobacteria bacterium]
MRDVGKECMYQKPIVCKRTSRLPFRWLGLCICLVSLVASLSGCGGESSWNLAPVSGDSCDVFKQLRDNEVYQKASAYDDPAKKEDQANNPKLRSPYANLFSSEQELGCLVLYRTDSQDKLITYQLTPVALTDRGNMRTLDPDTKKYDRAVRWKLSPNDLKGVALTMAVYVVPPGSLEGKEHEQFCKDFLEKRPDCFPADQSKPSSCWFWIEMSPQVPEDSPFALGGTQGTCKICSREVCGNNKDDDCDGLTDEGCGESDCHHLNATRPCYTGPENTRNIGLCKAGVQTCRAAKDATQGNALQWSACESEIKPKEEVCNGIDDNCNGQTDEGIANCCVVGQLRPCYTGSTENAGKGICVRGVEECLLDTDTKGGKFGSCQGDVKPAIESCNGKDDDCNGQIDDGLPVKDCKTKQQGECEAGKERCQDGKVECFPVKTPQQEDCNGLDDDCDGQVDELFPQRGQPCKVDGAQGPCAEGIRVGCNLGKVVCQALYKAEAVERCDDGIDNDCNGKVDEQDTAACACKAGDKRQCYTGPANTKGKGECKDGEQVCDASGQWGPCTGDVTPATEVCDGKDNNCDGSVDETFPTKGQLCFIVTGGAQGPCTYGKLDSCGASPTFKPECKAIYKAAASEICNNGIDDDCDGVIDNSPPCDCRQASSNQQPCSKMPKSLWNTGICKPGTQTCNFNGVWSGCLNEVPPALEVCDGKDNDCNGNIDEADPQLNNSCQVKNNDGVCKDGANQCKGGVLTCIAKITVPPQLDLCNGKDDDCNGKIDDSDPSVGKACAAAGKKGECAKGTLECTAGAWNCKATGTSQKEDCNGLDDDCNGQIDDNLSAPPCQTSLKGVCAQATKLCGGVKGWLDCEPGDFFRTSTLYEAKETLCDGKDNDCDGNIDADDQGQPLTRPCYADGQGKDGPANSRGVGACKDGAQTCSQGQWGKCENAVFPAAVTCDDKDNDCNGVVDKNELACLCTDEKAKGEVVIRTWGTGADGSLVINNKVILDQVAGNQLDRTPKSNRVEPDVTYHKVTAIGEQDVTVENTKGLADGDEIMLIHTQGNDQRVGTYELFRIRTVDQTKLTLSAKITQTFGASDNKSLDGQTILAVRVPQYKRITVTSNGELTVSSWNGSKGGILVFRAQELVRVAPGGKLSVTAMGYRGGAKVDGNSKPAPAGESITGAPTDSAGQNGGGHGGASSDKAYSGGGGGYGVKGENGLNQEKQPGGSGGQTYGTETLHQRIFMGSGGGSGGTDNRKAGESSRNETGAGGSGGGILIIIARTLNVAGEVSTNGSNGGDAISFGGAVGGGGGGAGGSLHIRVFNLQLYDGAVVTSNGGKGGRSAAEGPNNPKQPFGDSVGGQGGSGRLDLRLRQLNGKDATGDAKSYSFWTSPEPFAKPIPQQCVAPAVVPSP